MPGQLWIEDVAQAVPQEIDAEDGDEDGQTWPDRKPRGPVHVTSPLTQHGPPRGDAGGYP